LYHLATVRDIARWSPGCQDQSCIRFKGCEEHNLVCSCGIEGNTSTNDGERVSVALWY
jgi:hypothetical protein